MTKDADFADASAVCFDKLFALHKHPAGAAAWIEDAAFVWRKHLNEKLNDTFRELLQSTS